MSRATQFRDGFVHARARRSLLRVWQPLLNGLLSGLEAQSELSNLLDELYYDGLK
jgi:hypothetical protein